MKPITLRRLNEVIEAGWEIGFCLNCGEAKQAVKPHDHHVGCIRCGKFRVFGARYIRDMQWFSSS